MKNILRSYRFWLSLSGALLLLLRYALKEFGYTLDSNTADEIVQAVLGALVVGGFLLPDKKKKEEASDGAKEEQSATLGNEEDLVDTACDADEDVVKEDSDGSKDEEDLTDTACDADEDVVKEDLDGSKDEASEAEIARAERIVSAEHASEQASPIAEHTLPIAQHLTDTDMESSTIYGTQRVSRTETQDPDSNQSQSS